MNFFFHTRMSPLAALFLGGLLFQMPLVAFQRGPPTAEEGIECAVNPPGYVLKNLTEDFAQFRMRFFPERKVLLLLGARKRFAEDLIIVLALVKEAVVDATTRFKSFAQSRFLRGSRKQSELEGFSEHLFGDTPRQTDEPESMCEKSLPQGVRSCRGSASPRIHPGAFHPCTPFLVRSITMSEFKISVSTCFCCSSLDSSTAIVFTSEA